MMLAAAIWAAMATSTVEFDAFFATFRAKRAGVETVQAAFEQINVYPNDAETSEGSIVFAAPGQLVLQYEDPEVAYFVDDRAVFEYDAEVRQVLVVPLTQAPDAEAFILAFANAPERLQELYEVGLVEPEPGDDLGPILVLTPRPTGDGIEPPFRKAQLKLRDSDYLPTHIFIDRDEDTQVNILVREIVVNEPLAPTSTQIFVPAGTDIIQDDALVERVGEGGRWLPDPSLIADFSAEAEEPGEADEMPLDASGDESSTTP